VPKKNSESPKNRHQCKASHEGAFEEKNWGGFSGEKTRYGKDVKTGTCIKTEMRGGNKPGIGAQKNF